MQMKQLTFSLKKTKKNRFRTHSVSGDRYWLHIGSKSNYHTITTTTAPICLYIITTYSYICLTPQIVMFDIGRQT
jgi:hypothetical protein